MKDIRATIDEWKKIGALSRFKGRKLIVDNSILHCEALKIQCLQAK